MILMICFEDNECFSDFFEGFEKVCGQAQDEMPECGSKGGQGETSECDPANKYECGSVGGQGEPFTCTECYQDWCGLSKLSIEVTRVSEHAEMPQCGPAEVTKEIGQAEMSGCGSGQ